MVLTLAPITAPAPVLTDRNPTDAYGQATIKGVARRLISSP
jgi:hypothetical protein